MTTYFVISLLLITSFNMNGRNDLEWSSLASSIAAHADKNSEVDREVAVNAYRQISKEAGGLAQQAAQSLQKTFNGIELPKRFSEMSEAEIKAEAQSLVTKNKKEGGFREFLANQGITTTVK